MTGWKSKVSQTAFDKMKESVDMKMGLLRQKLATDKLERGSNASVMPNVGIGKPGSQPEKGVASSSSRESTSPALDLDDQPPAIESTERSDEKKETPSGVAESISSEPPTPNKFKALMSTKRRGSAKVVEDRKGGVEPQSDSKDPAVVVKRTTKGATGGLAAIWEKKQQESKKP